MSHLRSEPMSLMRFYITAGEAKDLVYHLLEYGKVQFVEDLSLNGSKNTIPEDRIDIESLGRRNEQLNVMLQEIKNELAIHGLLPDDQCFDNSRIEKTSELLGLHTHDIELEVEKRLQGIHIQRNFVNQAKLMLLDLYKLRFALKVANFFYFSPSPLSNREYQISHDDDMDNISSSVPLTAGESSHGVRHDDSFCRTIIGIIKADMEIAFRSSIYRSLRGNCTIHCEDILLDSLPNEPESLIFQEDPPVNQQHVEELPSKKELSKARQNKTAKEVTVVGAIRQSLQGWRICVVLVLSKENEIRVRNIGNAFKIEFFDMEQYRKNEQSLAEKISELDGTTIKEQEQLLLFCEKDYKRILAEFCKQPELSEPMQSKARMMLGEDDRTHSLWELMWVVQKNIRVYSILRLFQRVPALEGKSSSMLTCLAWIAKKDEDDLTVAIYARDAKPIVEVVDGFHYQPPTYLPVNKFTEIFQELCNSYGIPRYREVNPALFYLATFPFFFSVMFGDAIHGIIMLTIGLYMVILENELKRSKTSEITAMLFGGRYLILLMGAFSIPVGMIFNEYGSLALSVFGRSGWDLATTPATFKFAYPFGIDPAWRLAGNELVFVNSMKMKASIFMGVVHMSVGILLSGWHCWNDYDLKIGAVYKADFLLQTVPELLLLLCMFGYLSFLMVFKWTINWATPDAGSPPGLLNTMIFMFLAPGKVAAVDRLYAGQALVQSVLLLLAVVCIPWMLLGRPLYRLYISKRRRIVRVGSDERASLLSRGSSDGSLKGGSWGESKLDAGVKDLLLGIPEKQATGLLDAAEDVEGKVNDHDEQSAPLIIVKDSPSELASSSKHPSDVGVIEHGESFGEHMMEQAIHTIEFVLGTVSNTASYLRLWALSLAHGQLSKVLWEMIWENLVKIPIVGPLVAFVVWFSFTLCILLVMEGLSAFLHALRLHWVEFNNKFYKGDGYEFKPATLPVVILSKPSST